MGVSSLRNSFIFVVLLCLSSNYFYCICDNGESHINGIAHGSEDQQLNSADEPNIVLPVENTNSKEEIIPSDTEALQSSQSHQFVQSDSESEKIPSDIPVKVPKFGEPFKKTRRKENAEQLIKKKVKSSTYASLLPLEEEVEDQIPHSVVQETFEDGSSSGTSIPPVANSKDDDSILVKDSAVDDAKAAGDASVKKEHITPAHTKPVVTEIPSPNIAEKVDIPEVGGESPPLPTPVPESADHSQHHHHDAMPSFDEWKKMMLAEQQKGGHTVPSSGPPGKKLASQKRRRNYASYECGAKLVASNSEGEGTSRILNEMVDEYMLNPCKAKIWFVLELCESVQASQIELANFELFSSSPKDFAVYSSDNFPTRDWIPLGTFTATEQRVLQSFPLKQEGFGKFIKIELLSHYGKEHYCPLSVVRIFGTSMVDEYEEMETLSSHHVPPEDELDRLDLPAEDKAASNLFGSATDAVYNIVKKAAQVLGPRKSLDGGEDDEKSDNNASGANECKLINDSCSDKEGPNRITAAEFFLSASSIRRSLFQHLRRCDQCIYKSRPSYYSVSQPECRFFQATLGPVLFNTICDWFKDNIATLENLPVVVLSGNATGGSTKPASLPPTIISVIIDSNVSSAFPSVSDNTPTLPGVDELPLDSSTLKSSVKSIKSTYIVTEGESEVISPTRTLPNTEGESRASLSGSAKTVTPVEQCDSSKSVVKAGVEYAGSDSIPPSVVSVTFSASKEEVPATQSTSTSVPEVNGTKDSTVQPDESKKVDEMLGENATQIDDPLVVDTVTPTPIVDSGIDDYSDEFRAVEERFADVRDPATSTVVTSATLAQKESVFMRMSNRIKALELNMSLSGQYLQELSQRYRRQMEEMQRAFNRTIGTLNDTARKAAEKDMKQQDVISQLQAEVANLTQVVNKLISERDSASGQKVGIHVLLMVVQIGIVVTIMSLCVRHISSTFSTNGECTKVPIVTNKKRRNSADVAPMAPALKIQRRSVSEEVIPSGDEPIVVEPVIPVFSVPLAKVKKKSRKKKGGIHRSASNPTLSPRKSAAISSSFRKKLVKDEPCAAGIIFSHAKSKGLTNHRKVTHACENCKGNIKVCGNDNYALANSKNKRPANCKPLKNLTNGKIVCGISDSDTSNEKSSADFEKEKNGFNLKKFLRLQKRESI